MFGEIAFKLPSLYAFTGNTNITTLGTITTGTWNGSIISGTYGGTGVNNGSSTITLAGNLTTTGAYNTSFTQQGSYTITLPPYTSTLATIAGAETLTNKTLTAPVISSIVNTGTLTLPTSSDTLVGRATTDTLTNKTLTSPTLVTPALGTPASGNISNCTSTSMALTTPLITGITNGTPPTSGNVGEELSSIISSGSAVSFSNATPKDLTSKSFTAGIWFIVGNITYNPSIAMSSVQAWTSTTSATQPDYSLYYADSFTSAVSTLCSAIAPGRFYNFATTTTVYLTGQANFASGTVVAAGGLYGVRIA